MMRSFFCLALFLSLAGCSSSRGTDGEEMLLGWVGRPDFLTPAYPRFQARYDTVRADAQVVDLIRDVSRGTEWTVFLGSWCPDSYREVPAFLKIADSAGIEPSRIRYYALDRAKKSPGGYEKEFGVTHVPTIVFLRDGTEVGRIVEKSEGSMEDEMLKILLGEGPH